MRLSPAGRRVVTDLVWSLSLSNLLALPLWGELQTIHDWRYAGYWSAGGARRTLELATMADVLLVGLFFFAIFSAARLLPKRAGQPARDWIQAAAFVAIAVRLGELARTTFGFTGFLGVTLPECLAVGILVYLVVWRRGLLFSISRDAVFLLGWLLVLTFGPSAWYALAPPAVFHETQRAWTPRDRRAAPTRTLWLVFDEMDQKLAFEERPPWLRMPEFDHFRSESLHTDKALPPAQWTLESLPALMTGEAVVNAIPEGTHELRLTFSNGRDALWSKEPSVFTDAAKYGLQSGIVGWYHPYCRIFGRTFSVCREEMAPVWAPYPFPWREYAETIGFWRTLGIKMGRTLFFAQQYERFDRRSFPEFQRESWDYVRSQHQRCFRGVRDAALELVARPELGLLLVHVPIPHPPGIYDRRTRAYSEREDSDYFDNLMLADRFLGEVRHELQAANLWDGTTVLISADHQYRVPDWSDTPLWTAEMERSVAGRKLSTIPFLLKLPGQHREVRCSVPINTVVTRGLLQMLMQGRIHSPEDALQWLTEHRLKA